MRVFLVLAAAVMLGCGAGHAQSPTGIPAMGSAMGATSPLGTLGSSAPTGSNGGTGIPLGATEIDPGGLSPTASSTCNASGSSYSGLSGSSGSGMASMSGTNSSFDGGGFSSTGSVSSMSSCTSTNSLSSSGSASPLSIAGTNPGLTLNGGTIPLGATEIDNGGVSPLIGVPMPSTMTLPCIGSTTNASTAAATGSTSTGMGAPGMLPGC
jgi:hypothetical protein